MLAAHRSGDLSLGLAEPAGPAPPESTEAEHGPVRERCESVALAPQPGGPSCVGATLLLAPALPLEVDRLGPHLPGPR